MAAASSCPLPGGMPYATTPGGTRIIYDRKFLLECKNLPIAWTPLCYLPQISGVTVPPQAKELKEQKETEEIPDEAQFEMDI